MSNLPQTHTKTTIKQSIAYTYKKKHNLSVQYMPIDLLFVYSIQCSDWCLLALRTSCLLHIHTTVLRWCRGRVGGTMIKKGGSLPNATPLRSSTTVTPRRSAMAATWTRCLVGWWWGGDMHSQHININRLSYHPCSCTPTASV